MTPNDWRVLRAVDRACRTWDGFGPHGPRDWCAIRRLEREGFVEQAFEYGECQSCSESHECQGYRLTQRGIAALAESNKLRP